MSVFDPRTALKPSEYPDALKYKEKIHESPWTFKHWDYVADVQDYLVRLNSDQQTAIKRSMIAISQIEVKVKEFWGKLGDWFPKPEFKQVGYCFADSEVRHSDAYSHLLEILGLEHEFETALSSPEIGGRVEYLTKYLNSPSSDKKSYCHKLALFSIFVENVSLFSQFMVIKSFNKHFNLLKDMDNVIQATQKEETIHALFGIWLVNQIRSEFPDWFDESFEIGMKEACLKAYDAESKIIDWIYDGKELDHLPKETVKNYIRWRFNDSLRKIQIDPIFQVDEKQLASVRWMDEEILLSTNNDFFNKRPSTYAVGTKPITASELF